ncbi:FHA domain-containing protein [Streptomyces sp. NPDC005799]|uniref:FHA domain-containing protein n=1 Tax=Streptomyces sp. NPDC005799 TaxID=3154678 RepID=UPI0033CC06F9
MATVTRYRCPVDDGCPMSTRRGFCPTHTWQSLERVRVLLTDELDDEQGSATAVATDPPSTVGTASSNGATAADVGGQGGGARRPPEPDAGRPPRRDRQTGPHPRKPEPASVQLGLVIAGAIVPVRGVGEGSTFLGRDAPECAYVPGIDALDQVSRVHAELYWHAGVLYIRDTDSLNGTWIDDQEITRPTQLWPGPRRLRLGDDVHVDLVELDEYGAPR